MNIYTTSYTCRHIYMSYSKILDEHLVKFDKVLTALDKEDCVSGSKNDNPPRTRTRCGSFRTLPQSRPSSSRQRFPSTNIGDIGTELDRFKLLLVKIHQKFRGNCQTPNVIGTI